MVDIKNTTTIWTSDTCGCKIEYNNNDKKWAKTYFTCKLHQEKTKQTLLNITRLHNQGFNVNDKHPRPTNGNKRTKEEYHQIAKERAEELKRIKSLK